MGGLSSVPGLGRSPEDGKGYPLQYSGPENSMDCIVHGVEESWTQLSDFHFHQHQVRLDIGSSLFLPMDTDTADTHTPLLSPDLFLLLTCS